MDTNLDDGEIYAALRQAESVLRLRATGDHLEDFPKVSGFVMLLSELAGAAADVLEGMSTKTMEE